ncbi:MAG TPA: flagellar biosynthetic protein FliO [Solirubrobacteraceae bacterium]|nr:flagellar biosynthetic protein FliO [Solirubrobacteraceae bacterium]
MTKLTLPNRVAATVAAVLIACLFALACPLTALAAATAKGAGENTPLNLGSTPSTPHTSSGGASIVRTIVGLAIVIAVIWGVSWILRQVKAGKDPQVSSNGLASIAALQLGSGRSVHLVRAGSDYVLLGSAEHGVVPIHRYSAEEAEDAGLLTAIDVEPTRRRRALLGPGGGPGSSSGEGQDPMRMPSPNSSLIDRLREWTVRR